MSFLGMCIGPIAYLSLVYLNLNFSITNIDFILPGYLGIFLFICFTLILIVFFRRAYIIKSEEVSRPRAQKLFKTNTTSNYSLDSDNSDVE